MVPASDVLHHCCNVNLVQNKACINSIWSLSSVGLSSLTPTLVLSVTRFAHELVPATNRISYGVHSDLQKPISTVMRYHLV